MSLCCFGSWKLNLAEVVAPVPKSLPYCGLTVQLRDSGLWVASGGSLETEHKQPEPPMNADKKNPVFYRREAGEFPPHRNELGDSSCVRIGRCAHG